MTRTGRPRNTDIDAAIMRAMAELIAERGYSRVTVDDVVARAGTNKPAFYRRFRDLADIVPRILAARHGRDDDIDTGALVTDLREVQRRQQQLFTDPVVTRGFAGWIGELSVHSERMRPFVEGYLAPRRAYTCVILGRAVMRGEIAPGADPAWIADLLTGPLLMRVVMPGLPPIDGALIAQTVDAALDVLGYVGMRGGAAASKPAVRD
ncbi:TetR/AcrR family transcriptional regulator C-terminal ligand-binding domain-containing protein [Microbacterium sp.]|uniref:TetR/AcrR family transcriptional regulator C-terminal ligand-binding domain-containing protein n=1 Tax=Microbacterium sp. TaxID=51671 RepID=UPI0039E5C8F3